MEYYLEEVNGKGWRIKENRMLDSIMNRDTLKTPEK